MKREINPICYLLYTYIYTYMCMVIYSNKFIALRRYHWSLYFFSSFSIRLVNGELIGKALSIRMKIGYKTWLTVQNTLLVNWIMIVKIESQILKVIKSSSLIRVCIVRRWYSVKCIMMIKNVWDDDLS